MGGLCVCLPAIRRESRSVIRIGDLRRDAELGELFVVTGKRRLFNDVVTVVYFDRTIAGRQGIVGHVRVERSELIAAGDEELILYDFDGQQHEC